MSEIVRPKNEKQPSRLRRGIFLVLGATGLATGCIPPTEEPVGPETATISARVGGDSITDGADKNIEETVTNVLLHELNANNYYADVQSKPGATTAQMLTEMPQEGHETDITGLAYGTNDAHDGPNGGYKVSLSDYENNINTYINNAGSACYFFVEINESVDTNYKGNHWNLDDNGPVFNNKLREIADEHDNVFFIEGWADWVANNPEKMSGGNDVHFDGPATEAAEEYRQQFVTGTNTCAVYLDSIDYEPRIS